MSHSPDQNAPSSHSINTGYGPENPSVDAPIDRAFAFAMHSRPPKSRIGKRITVCAAAELPPGTRRIVDCGNSLSIGIFNVGGDLYAVKNVCPHYGAPLCQGTLHATHRPAGVHVIDPVLQGRVLRCPWHGWEFDIATGQGLYDQNSRVATYCVEVDPAGDVTIIL